MPSILFLDLSGLNAAITSAGYPHINEVLFAMGGGGYGGSGDGVRFGGLGGGGETVSANEGRNVRFGLDYYGFLLEKATESNSELTVVLGAVLGGGSLELRLIDRFPDSFDDAVGSPYVISMTKSFYMLQPYVAFEARPLNWMATRLQLGFLWGLTDPWAFEEVQFSGPPRTLTGLIASLTVQFGGYAADEGNGSAEVERLPESEDEQFQQPQPDDAEQPQE
jgi:hypothetical protein